MGWLCGRSLHGSHEENRPPITSSFTSLGTLDESPVTKVSQTPALPGTAPSFGEFAKSSYSGMNPASCSAHGIMILLHAQEESQVRARIFANPFGGCIKSPTVQRLRI